MKIKKILIANRGEIARRVIRTAKEMNIGTVAVYSDSDATMPFVAEADESYPLPGLEAKDTYLQTDKILAIAKESGADAIHPGYGFLSENSGFAGACKDAGIIFIGPTPDVIDLMGDKIKARNAMIEAGVPVVPGFDSPDQDPAVLKEEAEKIGYPLLIKATAGGGGKGMRRVDSGDEFQAALEAAKREAASAFGNDRVFLEKYITNPRHIEVQVIGDGKGNVLHLYERECSIQRRHQKIIEETPSPFVDDKLRADITETAIKAAKKVDYLSAGTVEFIMGDDKKYYFLEMNTRLQVEHPVTELVCDVDLVRMMIEVAQGDGLTKKQADIKQTGHAIESRLYAEDPENNFLPATGKLALLRFEEEDDKIGQIRIDSGVETGNEVSIYFDPMIAKLISYGADRKAAIKTMQRCLTDTVVFGVKTNRAFLLDIVKHKGFMKADTTTHFIGQNYPDGFDETSLIKKQLVQDEAIKLALAANLYREMNENSGTLPGALTAWDATQDTPAGQ